MKELIIEINTLVKIAIEIYDGNVPANPLQLLGKLGTVVRYNPENLFPYKVLFDDGSINFFLLSELEEF